MSRAKSIAGIVNSIFPVQRLADPECRRAEAKKLKKKLERLANNIDLRQERVKADKKAITAKYISDIDDDKLFQEKWDLASRREELVYIHFNVIKPIILGILIQVESIITNPENPAPHVKLKLE